MNVKADLNISSRRINCGGNYCGHNPTKPDLSLRSPVRKGKGGVPRVLTLLIERVAQYYHRPTLLPTLNLANGSDRQQRSERREACVITLAVLIGHTEVSSLRVGMNTPQGFVNFDFEWLRKKTRLSTDRLKRSIADLKRAGLITVSQGRQLQPDGTWKGFSAVKAVNSRLFGALGLSKMLSKERKKAVKRLEQKVQQWNKNGTQRTLTDICRFALVVSSLKTAPAPRAKSSRKRQRPTNSPPPPTSGEGFAFLERKMAELKAAK